MTSANVTEYRIFRDGKEVGSHRQHHYCKTRWHELLKFEPMKDHSIQPHGLDEYEIEWETATVPLVDFFVEKAHFPFLGLCSECKKERWSKTTMTEICCGNKMDVVYWSNC